MQQPLRMSFLQQRLTTITLARTIIHVEKKNDKLDHLISNENNIKHNITISQLQ